MARERDDADRSQGSELERWYQSSESSFRAPSLSDLTSSSQDSDTSTKGRSRSKKRRRPEANSDGARQQAKRVRVSHYDQYRALFNQSVADISRRGLVTKLPPWSATQTGVTAWSTREKECLFNSIESFGRRDLPAIARAIATKIGPEVYEFIDRLEGASVNRHIYGDQRDLLDASTIPAAFEIDVGCDAALEEAADVLARYQKQVDQTLEKKRHGNDWLLTPKLATKLEYCLTSNDDGEAVVAKDVPSAVLLNLQAFLELSSRLFMNSTDPEYNWRSFADRLGRPSIFFSAFAQLGNIVLAVTERLVQSALFLALSRLRAINAFNHKANYVVTARDVRAALEIADMKSDAHGYWVGLSRRCKLDIIDERGRTYQPKISGRKLKHAEVESILDEGRNEEGRYSRSISRQQNRTSSAKTDTSCLVTSSADSDQEELRNGSVSEDQLPSSPALSDSKLTFGSAKIIRAQNRYDHDQLTYLSAYDHRASLEEEKHLWSLLDKEDIHPISSKDVIIPKKPVPERRHRIDFQDWTKAAQYHAEWELGRTLVPDEKFSRNRQIWRKRQRRPSQWEDLEVMENEDGTKISDIESVSDSDSNTIDDRIEDRPVDQDGIVGNKIALSGSELTLDAGEQHSESSSDQHKLYFAYSSSKALDADEASSPVVPEAAPSSPSALSRDDESDDSSEDDEGPLSD